MDEQVNFVADRTKKSFSFGLLMVLCFLLPIFVIPSQTFSFLAGKSSLLMIAVFLLLVAWLIEKVKNKDFSFSTNVIILSTILVPFAYLLSALFSGSIKATTIGLGFNLTTFSVITVLFLMLVLVARLFDTKKKIIYLYMSLLCSSVLIFFFQLLRLIFGPNFLSLGVFTTATSNFIGTWTELGIFFGLISVLSLLVVSFMKDSKAIKFVGYIALVISLFFIALVNASSIWFILALISLVFVIYGLLTNKTPEKKISAKALPITSLVVFVISLIFVFARGPVGGLLPSLFGVANYEVRPSTGATVDIIQTTLSTDPVLGIGPNQFVKQWSVNKPVAINNTQFWNTDFNSGSSFLLTTLVEVGLLGFLAWLLFFGTIVYLGLRLLKIKQQNKFNQYISLSVVFATIYLWAFSFVYVPGIVILSLSFIFTGALLSLSYQEGLVKLKPLSSSEKGGRNIALIISGVVVLLAFICNGYFFVKKTMASTQAQNSLVALNVEGDLGKAIELMSGATTTFGNDLYYRLLSEMDLLQLQAVLGQKDVDQETIQSQFQNVFNNAILDSEAALGVDLMSYQNWASLGKVYASVVPLKIEGMYDKAIEAYGNAVSLNPNNPSLALALANLELANGDMEKTKNYAMTALQMKNNYSDAYAFLSQIELNNDNQEEAVNIISAWAQAVPNDPQPLLQLGFFNYNSQKYAEAIPFLEGAANLDPYSIDTLYLLGLSYDGAGETDKALNLFGSLSQAMPEDANLKAIFENIQAGRDPLYGLNQQPPTEAPAVSQPVSEDNLLDQDLEIGDNTPVEGE